MTAPNIQKSYLITYRYYDNTVYISKREMKRNRIPILMSSHYIEDAMLFKTKEDAAWYLEYLLNNKETQHIIPTTKIVEVSYAFTDTEDVTDYITKKNTNQSISLRATLRSIMAETLIPRIEEHRPSWMTKEYVDLHKKITTL